MRITQMSHTIAGAGLQRPERQLHQRSGIHSFVLSKRMVHYGRMGKCVEVKAAQVAQPKKVTS